MSKKKTTEKKESLQALSVDELQARLRENEEIYFRLKFRHASNRESVKNPMEIRETRREVARLKTILHQKEREAA